MFNLPGTFEFHILFQKVFPASTLDIEDTSQPSSS